jgi:hypothetical protein
LDSLPTTFGPFLHRSRICSCAAVGCILVRWATTWSYGTWSLVTELWTMLSTCRRYFGTLLDIAASVLLWLGNVWYCSGVQALLVCATMRAKIHNHVRKKYCAIKHL